MRKNTRSGLETIDGRLWLLVEKTGDAGASLRRFALFRRLGEKTGDRRSCRNGRPGRLQKSSQLATIATSDLARRNPRKNGVSDMPDAGLNPKSD
jgi:hypothetical protein